MPTSLMILMPKLTGMVFMFAVGACVGSLVNVLVYRMPLGIGVITPASRCPWCGKILTWRENIPILGWLSLRGRCRFCTAPISPEYPIVETIVAVMFGSIFALWYVVPDSAVWLGMAWGEFKPEWAGNGFVRSWPALAVFLVLLGSMTAMTIIDARTFTIPLTLTWVPAVVALVLHTGHAAWAEIAQGPIELVRPGQWRFENGMRWESAVGWVWSLATPGSGSWQWIGAAFGGTLGLGVSVLLLRFGLIRQSFADYAEWEKAELEKRGGPAVPDQQDPRGDDPQTPPPIPDSETEPTNEPQGEPECENQPAEQAIDEGSDADLWIQYPYARREMLKEIAFLGAPVGLGFLGARLVPAMVGPEAEAPLWVTVLAGVLLGYLIGGGVVWAVRVLGSLAFGKEAMGLGDVHLMAAVGACVGWIDATLAFFGAAFVGVAYVVVGAIVLRKMPRTMPYGPFLAVATVLVVVGKPAVELLLSRVTGGAVDLP